MFFDMLIKHEGGFTDDQRDNGNAKGDGHGNEGSMSNVGRHRLELGKVHRQACT